MCGGREGERHGVREDLMDCIVEKKMGAFFPQRKYTVHVNVIVVYLSYRKVFID